MQLKTVGESSIAFNAIDTIMTKTAVMSNSASKAKVQLDLLKISLEGYSLEATKSAISQSTLNAEQIKAILASKGLEGQILETTTAELAQVTANNANAASQKTATVSSGKFSLALKGLASTLGTTKLLLGGISVALGLFYIAFSKYKQSVEETRQATEESANAYKEASSSIEDYTKRYQELREALLAAKGNEEETYNVKKQLLDLQTELNDKFGEEYGALNLVTDAYKDQTEAIKSLNKEAAQTFLNENREGLEQAVKEMNKERTFNLSYSDVSGYTEEGQALKKIAEKYGIKVNENGEGIFNLILKTDAKSGYDTINNFMSEVEELKKDFKDSDLLDSVLEISSVELNKAKKVIDNNAESIKQKLIAEIQSDNSAGGKLDIYTEAVKAVDAYNEAVLKSEDPFNDEKVAKARKNLDKIKSKIEENSDEWEEYASITDELFDKADTKLLDFYEELQNNSGLKKFSEQLKGLSRVDLLAMENDGKHDAFDSLTNSAESYGVKVEELIDLLIKLGVVQDDISSDSSELKEPKWDYSTTLENLDKVKNSLDVLDKTFAKLFDADELIEFEDLSSINEAFQDLDGVEDYIKRIQEAGQDSEKICQIFGEMTGAYLEHAGVLSNVTEENKNLIISMLEEMGIVNAEDIVLAQLGQTTETVALQKQFLTEKGYELINATIEEVVQFLNEANASNEAKQSIAQLALAKLDANNTRIDTSADIDNIVALANAAGASASAIAKFKRAASTVEYYKEHPNSIKGPFLASSKLLLNSVENSTYDWEYKKLDPNVFKINSSSKYTPKYSGGSSTSKAIEQAKKDAEKASKETEDTFEKTMDFFERRVEVLTDAFNNLEKGMENVFGADAKNTLLTAQIGVLNEEVNNYTDALTMYRQKANEALSGVSDDFRDKIVNGTVQITDFIGKGNEDVIEAMEAYQGWADKVSDCTQKLEELKTQIRQLELQKFNNIIEDFTNQFDIHGDAVDLINKQIGLLEEAGQLIGESFYTKQIEQSEKQLNTLETEKKRLIEQLNEALSSGRVKCCPLL